MTAAPQSYLTPLARPTRRTAQQAITSSSPAPAPPVTMPLVERVPPPEQQRVVSESFRLTIDEARALSIETLNMLVREDPSLVAQLIIAAGRKRRGELTEEERLPQNPAARAIALAGQARRNEISAADRIWLDDYLRGNT